MISGATPTDMNNFGPNFKETVGVCMLCMTGCNACAYGLFGSQIGAVGIYCTSCNPGYTYNYVYGNCSICPANCQTCTCEGNTCWSISCITCASGYTLETSGCMLDTTAALAGGPGGSE